MTPAPACINSNPRFSQSNQAYHTPSFSYPLVFYILFPSLSTLSHSLLHYSTIIAAYNVNSPLSISPSHDHVLIVSSLYTKYSIQWVQHTPKIRCLSIILTIINSPLNVASVSSILPCKFNCHQPALHQSSQVKSHSHTPMADSSLTDQFSLVNCWRISDRPLSSSPSISLNHSLYNSCCILFNHCLRVYLWLDLIMASKCITILAQWWCQSV